MFEAPGGTRERQRSWSAHVDRRRARSSRESNGALILARYVFIVSPRHPELRAYLEERFADDPKVQVIEDRRRGERRRAHAAVDVDRRRGDRRTRPEVDAELRERSHTVVTIP